MRLPEGLQDKPYSSWNQLMRDLYRVWQLAAVFNCQDALEQFVASDEDGCAAEFLACLTNGYRFDWFVGQDGTSRLAPAHSFADSLES
jgi:hypothetical protein